MLQFLLFLEVGGRFDMDPTFPEEPTAEVSAEDIEAFKGRMRQAMYDTVVNRQNGAIPNEEFIKWQIVRVNADGTPGEVLEESEELSVEAAA